MELLSNPILLTILGAFLGALFGWIFSNKSTKEKTNLTIVETKIIVNNKDIVKTSSRTRKTNNDGLGVILIALAVVGIVIFLYVRYAREIFSYLMMYNVFACCFIISVIIKSIYFKSLKSFSWWSRLVFPLLMFSATIFLTRYLERNIPNEIIELANSEKITPNLELTQVAMNFYKGLTKFGMIYLAYQLMSLLLVLIVSLMCFLNFLHYFSLMNLRSGSVLNFWTTTYRKTKQFSGTSFYVISILFIAMVIIIAEFNL